MDFKATFFKIRDLAHVLVQQMIKDVRPYDPAGYKMFINLSHTCKDASNVLFPMRKYFRESMTPFNSITTGYIYHDLSDEYKNHPNVVIRNELNKYKGMMHPIFITHLNLTHCVEPFRDDSEYIATYIYELTGRIYPTEAFTSYHDTDFDIIVVRVKYKDISDDIQKNCPRLEYKIHIVFNEYEYPSMNFTVDKLRVCEYNDYIQKNKSEHHNITGVVVLKILNGMEISNYEKDVLYKYHGKARHHAYYYARQFPKENILKFKKLGIFDDNIINNIMVMHKNEEPCEISETKLDLQFPNDYHNRKSVLFYKNNAAIYDKKRVLDYYISYIFSLDHVVFPGLEFTPKEREFVYAIYKGGMVGKDLNADHVGKICKILRAVGVENPISLIDSEYKIFDAFIPYFKF